MAYSGVLAALICLPWFIADPQAFISRVGGALLLGESSVRTDSMSLGGLAAEFDLPLPRILLLVLFAIVVWAVVRAGRAWPEAEGAVPLLATALLMAGVLVLSTHAFYNHWWAVMALLAAGLACLRPRPGHGSVSDRTAEGRSGRAEAKPSVL